ncbi:uncharacterized protein ASCRUDRAFT_132714 [Ascoidea rubescens DSM 1968]|uniref:RRM domain-containing protein n=1 Tax=Ascoidea rubescens DSM 1968 TaxID=1344418 RepID=A0A1D2VKW9_9ASCO|nr:hypothetical protein ASCRUDRAFT_132714 [Ascoidea rubescens DSM 1968]ODV62187.1 hypothetical protein ASCRUDRAFT_132714 [Ascoidea rubescens DSM 1968]
MTDLKGSSNIPTGPRRFRERNDPRVSFKPSNDDFARRRPSRYHTRRGERSTEISRENSRERIQNRYIERLEESQRPRQTARERNGLDPRYRRSAYSRSRSTTPTRHYMSNSRSRSGSRSRSNQNLRSRSRDDYRSRSNRYSDKHSHLSNKVDPETVISIEKRDRSSYTLWDLKPQGFEEISAEKAKISGFFLLPGIRLNNNNSNNDNNNNQNFNIPKENGDNKLGLKFQPNLNDLNNNFNNIHNRKLQHQQQLDLRKFQNFLIDNVKNDATLKTITDPNSNVNCENSSNSKRILVRNLTDNSIAPQIIAYINDFLDSIHNFFFKNPIQSYVVLNNTIILQCQDFRIPSILIALDGRLIDHLNFRLSISRPDEYIIPNSTQTSDRKNSYWSIVPDSDSKLVISNIPLKYDDESLKQKISAISDIENLCLLKEKNNPNINKDIAFLTFKDWQNTSKYIEKLNSFELEGSKLICKRCCAGYQQNVQMNCLNLLNLVKGTDPSIHKKSNVLLILNSFNVGEILDKQSTAVNKESNSIIQKEIVEKVNSLESDFREECSKYGEVIDIKIPHLENIANFKKEIGANSNFGKIFIKFKNSEICSNVMKNISGRKYNDRLLLSTYFSESDFELDLFK